MRGYRKVIVALAGLIVSAFLLWFARLDAELFADITIMIVLAFVGGNGVEHVAKFWGVRSSMGDGDERAEQTD